jgi:hypothetical protein
MPEYYDPTGEFAARSTCNQTSLTYHEIILQALAFMAFQNSVVCADPETLRLC